jgi:hypothetical protein
MRNSCFANSLSDTILPMSGSSARVSILSVTASADCGLSAAIKKNISQCPQCRCRFNDHFTMTPIQDFDLIMFILYASSSTIIKQFRLDTSHKSIWDGILFLLQTPILSPYSSWVMLNTSFDFPVKTTVAERFQIWYRKFKKWFSYLKRRRKKTLV